MFNVILLVTQQTKLLGFSVMNIKRRSFIGGLLSMAITDKALASNTKIKMSKYDREILAKTVYGEARGEDVVGMFAVCNTVFNRVRSNHPLFKNDTSIAKACLRKKQYSCWNSHHIHNFDGKSDIYHKILEVVDIALMAYNSGDDYSHHATHYFKKNTPAPDWIHDMKHTVTIDDHLFYKPKA